MGSGLGTRGRDRPPPKQTNIIGEASASPLDDRAYVRITSQGTRAQFVWHVKDLGGPVEMRLAAATQVVGIPRYGDWSRSLGVFVTGVRADQIKGCPTQAHVTVDWGIEVEGGVGWFDNEPSETEPAAIEVVSTVQSTTTNMHMAGAEGVVGTQILVHHLEEVPEGEEGPPYARPQGGEVAYEQPMNMVIFRRRENVSPGRDVPGGRQRSIMYLAHTNETAFLGDVAGTWLCTKMSGHSDDNGATWNNTYEFQRREPTTFRFMPTGENPVPWNVPIAGWDALAIYRDPVTGEPITVTDLSEVTVVQHYRKAEFHDLRLYVP